MKKLCIIALVILGISALILAGCAKPAPAPSPSPAAPALKPSPTLEKVIELKFAHWQGPKTRGQVFFVEPWVKKIEEGTSGRVKITIYPAETLVGAKETIEAAKQGRSDIAWQDMGLFAARFPLSEVMLLPFLNLPSGKVDGRTLSGAGINSHILWELYEKFPEMQAEWAELKLLFLFNSDARFFMTNKPVRNMADLKGMKMRETGGPPIDMLKALGASPIAMTMPDVYEAAQKGVIDGAAVTWSSVVSFKLYEVFRYRINAETLATEFFVIMNKQKWESLPADVQKVITSVSGMYGAEFAGDAMFGTGAEKAVRDEIAKAGKKLEEINLDPGEFDKWKTIGGKPIWDKWVSDMAAKGLPGQKVLDEAQRLIGKYK